MGLVNKDIIAQLRRDILPLGGLRPANKQAMTAVNLGPIDQAFPNKTFPLGAIHEFCCTRAEDAAATGGFITGILGTLMSKGGVALWISSSRSIFPPSLKLFGIEPDKIVFIDLQREKDILWTIEEALKCEGIAAVVGELSELSFTASRRLQLAVEQSRTTGFIIRHAKRPLNTTASVTRWKITPLPGVLPDEMPGLGFPRWQVSLLKVRNGSPGSWQVEWISGRMRTVPKLTSIPLQQRRKTG
jgi:protein ImuA